MSNGEGYIRQISSIDEALKRLNAETKALRTQRTLTKQRLYEWMKSRRLDEYQGYNIDKIVPKPKIPRKKAKEKKEDAMRLFKDIGVDDPEELWVAFQNTQKHVPQPDADAAS